MWHFFKRTAGDSGYQALLCMVEEIIYSAEWEHNKHGENAGYRDPTHSCLRNMICTALHLRC